MDSMFGFGAFGEGASSAPKRPERDKNSVSYRWGKICESIERRCIECGRDPKSVKVVAVSKHQPVEKVDEAIAAGLEDFGENYVQEARSKAVASAGARWHLVGPLQRNKVNMAVDLFAGIHSLHNLPLIQRLDKRCQTKNRKMWGLIQVRLGGEASKSGVSPQELFEILEQLREASPQALRLRGLMAVPPPVRDPEENRPHFKKLKDLLSEVIDRDYPFWCGEELSMGMSGDYLVAIEEGATYVRLGTVLFGER